MSTKKTIKKEVVKATVKLVQKKKKKVKAPKFKLISYTIKATIPTGQYANIQPEVTVSAESIEAAERAVMPYIETLFARYRDGGVQSIVARSAAPGAVVPVITSKQPVPPTPAAVVVKESEPTPTPAIVLTVPFTRAKGALESCTSLEAFELVMKQIRASTKLISTEKVELEILAAKKSLDLNGTQA